MAGPPEKAVPTTSPWRVDRIDGAQQDIYRLIDFATEHGTPISIEVMHRAVDIARLNPISMSAEQEEALWHTRRDLSEIVAPAHASGLHLMDLLEADAPATVEPRTLRGWSGRWLLVAMLTVAATHVYTVVGRQLTTDAGNQLYGAGTLAEATLGATSGVPSQSSPQPAAAPGTPPPRALSLEDADLQIAKQRMALDAQRARLAAWNSVWRLWRPGVQDAAAAADSDVPDPTMTASASEPPAANRQIRAVVKRFMLGTLSATEAERYAADVAQTTLMTYVLPILYGALGAFVFVVRLVTNDIDRGSLRMLLRIRYRMRLMLGATFGLTVSMLTTQASPFIKEIPIGAVGVAFLAGYGIDVVFGLLDAVIGQARRLGFDRLASRPPDPPPVAARARA
jgi:transposase